MKYTEIATQTHDANEFVFDGEHAVTDLFTRILQDYPYPEKHEKERFYFVCLEGRPLRIRQHYMPSLDGRANCRLICEEMSCLASELTGDAVIQQMRRNFSALVLKTQTVLWVDAEAFEEAWVLTIQCMPPQLYHHCFIGTVCPKRGGLSLEDANGIPTNCGVDPVLQDFVPTDALFLKSAMHTQCMESGISVAKIKKAFVFATLRFNGRDERISEITGEEIYQFLPISAIHSRDIETAERVRSALYHCLCSGIALHIGEAEAFTERRWINRFLLDYLGALRSGNTALFKNMAKMLPILHITSADLSEETKAQIKCHLKEQNDDITHAPTNLFLSSLVRESSYGSDAFLRQMMCDTVFRRTQLCILFENPEEACRLLESLSEYDTNRRLHSLKRLIQTISKDSNPHGEDFGIWVHEVYYCCIPIKRSSRKYRKMSCREYKRLTAGRRGEAQRNRIDYLYGFVHEDFMNGRHDMYQTFFRRKDSITGIVRKRFRDERRAELRMNCKEKLLKVFKISDF